MIKLSTKTTGGRTFDQLLRNAGKGGAKHTDVGLFEASKYPDGTPAAAVAAKQEWGARKPDGSVATPERPFMRKAIKSARKAVRAELRRGVDPLQMVVSFSLAKRVGAVVENEIKRKLEGVSEPPNAPPPVASKGSADPLISTGKMKASVTYRVK